MEVTPFFTYRPTEVPRKQQNLISGAIETAALSQIKHSLSSITSYNLNLLFYRFM